MVIYRFGPLLHEIEQDAEEAEIMNTINPDGFVKIDPDVLAHVMNGIELRAYKKGYQDGKRTE